jgi:hypothetical protein
LIKLPKIPKKLRKQKKEIQLRTPLSYRDKTSSPTEKLGWNSRIHNLIRLNLIKMEEGNKGVPTKKRSFSKKEESSDLTPSRRSS